MVISHFQVIGVIVAKSGGYLFGPVVSRRLGLSLGVDIVPLKTCSQNCVYCQLGIDGVQTLDRREYVPIEEVLEELRGRIAAGLRADYITLSGSGEPTLHSRLGELIEGIRQLTDIPIAVITNGTMLTDSAVRANCAGADVVLPSLDAGDAETFKRINRPHDDIDFDLFVQGLCRFRQEYAGQIWLEVFFVEGINTDDEQVDKIRGLIERIRPDKVHLNTAVRPTTADGVVRVEPARLAAIAERIGHDAEVVASFSAEPGGEVVGADSGAVLEMLRRRPCSVDDVCAGLGIDQHQGQELLAELIKTRKAVCEMVGTTAYFRVPVKRT